MAGKLFGPDKRNVVPAPKVNVPPAGLRFAVRFTISSVPPETERPPLIVTLPFKEAAPLDLLTVRLLNVVAAMVWLPIPLNVTVDVPAVNEPVLTQFPPILIDEPFACKVVPVLIVIFPVVFNVPPRERRALVDNVRAPPTVTADDVNAVPAVLSIVRL